MIVSAVALAMLGASMGAMVRALLSIYVEPWGPTTCAVSARRLLSAGDARETNAQIPHSVVDASDSGTGTVEEVVSAISPIAGVGLSVSAGAVAMHKVEQGGQFASQLALDDEEGVRRSDAVELGRLGSVHSEARLADTGAATCSTSPFPPSAAVPPSVRREDSSVPRGQGASSIAAADSSATIAARSALAAAGPRSPLPIAADARDHIAGIAGEAASAAGGSERAVAGVPSASDGGGAPRMLAGDAAAAKTCIYNFPASTFLANVIGSFILAVVSSLSKQRSWPPFVSYAIGTGFCGGLTTMSTFVSEVVTLTAASNSATAALYLFTTLVSCLGLSALGWFLGSLAPSVNN